jgi:hypothetical protein
VNAGRKVGPCFCVSHQGEGAAGRPRVGPCASYRGEPESAECGSGSWSVLFLCPWSRPGAFFWFFSLSSLADALQFLKDPSGTSLRFKVPPGTRETVPTSDPPKEAWRHCPDVVRQRNEEDMQIWRLQTAIVQTAAARYTVSAFR